MGRLEALPHSTESRVQPPQGPQSTWGGSVLLTTSLPPQGWRGPGASPRGLQSGTNNLTLATPAGQGQAVQAGTRCPPAASGVHVRPRLPKERLLPQAEPGALGTRGGVVVVAVPVEDS